MRSKCRRDKPGKPTASGAGAGSGSSSDEEGKTRVRREAARLQRQENDAKAAREAQHLRDVMSKNRRQKMLDETKEEEEERDRRFQSEQEEQQAAEQEEAKLDFEMSQLYQSVGEVREDEEANEMQAGFVGMPDESVRQAIELIERSIQAAPNSDAMQRMFDHMARQATEGDPYGFQSYAASDV